MQLDTAYSKHHDYRKSKGFTLYKLFLALTFAVCLTGCIHIISPFDVITYKSLIDLKVEMKYTFEEFSTRGTEGKEDLEKLQTFKVKTTQFLEYEKGKEKNSETVQQIEILDSLITEVVNRFKQQEKLSVDYCKLKWLNIERQSVMFTHILTTFPVRTATNII